MRLPWTRWQRTLHKLGLKLVFGPSKAGGRKIPSRRPQIEQLERREVMTSQVMNLHLVNDTGTVGDNITSDSRLEGYVSVSYSGTMPYQVRVAFDQNNDGTVDGSVSTSYSGGTVAYDPRLAGASWSSFVGAMPLRYRLEELDSSGQSLSVGSWNNFPISILAPLQRSFCFPNLRRARRPVRQAVNVLLWW